MNFMDEKDLKPEKKTEESEDGYSFMNETVKPPPPDVGKLRKTILKLIAAGAIYIGSFLRERRVADKVRRELFRVIA